MNDFVGGNFQQLGRLAHALVLLGEIGPRRVAGQRLDAAHAGSDRALAHDLEDADIAGAPDMGAAAQLDGISVAGPPALGIHAHADDADLLAIFLAEQRQRPLRDRLVGRHEMGLDRRVLQDLGVDQVLHRADLVMGHGLLVREIESEPPGLDQRALLRHMSSQHLAQRLMQEVGRRMMGAGRQAARVVHFEQHFVADLQCALFHHAVMKEESMELLLRVADLEAGTFGAGQRAAVADLAAGFGIERGLVGNDDAALARL